MQKWEYKLVDHVDSPRVRATGDLNKEGEEGWELIVIDFPYHYFKRSLVKEAKTTPVEKKTNRERLGADNRRT
jgi:hypothetical protein